MIPPEGAYAGTVIVECAAEFTGILHDPGLSLPISGPEGYRIKNATGNSREYWDNTTPLRNRVTIRSQALATAPF